LAAALLLHLFTVAQTRVIKGKVQDDHGVPLPGASVMIKGSGKGTSTNNEGTFEISVPPKAILVISAVGFTTKEINTIRRTDQSQRTEHTQCHDR
jgi:hypothetical protein